MGTQARSKQRVRSRSGAPRGLEWVGGRLQSPFYVTEGTPFRPEMTLWIEMPDRLIVFAHIHEPGQPAPSFGDTLREAMASPLTGPPRRPAVVRVADPGLAMEALRVLPMARILEAATPELREVLDLMLSAAAEEAAAAGKTAADAGSEEPSYFEDGRVGGQAVAALFRAADALYRLAPWKAAADTQVLRVDIPAYEVAGACLSIIGNAGESLGFVLFPSLAAFEEFLHRAEAHTSPDEPFDMGTTILSLNYDAGADLPAAMYREALQHGWPVADARAYPTVAYQDPDGVRRPLAERDVRVVTACAAGLAAFFKHHRRIFSQDVFDMICESYDHEGVEVRISAPAEAAADLPEDADADTDADTDADADAGAGAPAVGLELDARLVDRMGRFARRRFGPAWMAAAAAAFREQSVPQALLGPWALYHEPYDGKPIIAWFHEAHAHELSPRELAWVNAQRAAWLSVWEVLDAEPGRSLTLRDLLTEETRVVKEATVSRTLVKRDTLLARVVDEEGSPVLCGVYHLSLPPADAHHVVERARGRLKRSSRVPVERMRDADIGRYLIARWEEALAAADARSRRRPELQNTDGDPLLLTADRFAFHPADRAKIQRRLDAMKDAEESPEEGAEAVYVFNRPGNRQHANWDSTIIGRVTVSTSALSIETNSVKRADALRARLESALGPLIRHRDREHTDPVAAAKERRGRGAPPAPRGPAPEGPEVDALVREFKAKHYADWVDHPLPALGGLTPRAAVRTKRGRAAVDLLLREIENGEARLPAGQRFDVGVIRRELGLNS